MNGIADQITTQIRGHSAGAQVFLPWWDSIEENALIGFVALGELFKHGGLAVEEA